MYCYEKPRTEDKTRVHKSFSLSTTQSLPDVAQRKFVGWDSEELSGNPQPKTGNLSGYSVNSIRIHYSPSGPVSNGIRMNDNSRCIQFQLPEDVKEEIVQELKQKILCKEEPFTKPVNLTIIVQKWINDIPGSTWNDAVEIAKRIKDEVERETRLQKVNQETELQDEPPNPERISLEGVEVSFVGEEEEWFIDAYQKYKNYIDPIILQPFESPFPATDGQTYYHKEGFLGGKEKSKPIWQVVEKADNKVKIQLLGLYRHENNDTSSYEIYIPFKHRAPRTIMIDGRPLKKLLNRQQMTVSKASTQSKKEKNPNSKKSRKK